MEISMYMYVRWHDDDGIEVIYVGDEYLRVVGEYK